MHQIVQRLGLCRRPHWGSSQRSKPLAGKKGKRMGKKGTEEERGEGGKLGSEVKGREGKKLLPLTVKSGYALVGTPIRY